jgi:hypothetical protein
MQLTDRDLKVLGHLAASRWLSTGQAAALCFARVSRTMACRRLRLMRRARYVRTSRENPMMEALHTLGPRGRQALAELGDGRTVALERFPPANRRHFLGVNDIRVAVFLSAERDGIELNFFFASWELQDRHWPYRTIPDAVTEVTQNGRTASAIFEYDRSTESLRYLVERKLKRYAEGLRGFSFTRVITVVEDSRRLRRLEDKMAGTIGELRFEFMLREELSHWSVRGLLSSCGSGDGSGDGSCAGTVLRT